MQGIGVSLYFDVENSVIVVPRLQHPVGYGVMSCKFIELKTGYTNSALAETIMSALEISTINEQEDRSKHFWTEATGIKGFVAFSKRYRCVSIEYVLEKDGYSVVAKKRYKDGSYGYDKEDIPLRVKEYPGKPRVETIAEQVMEALKIV